MLKIAGLYTSYNELLAPEGSLSVAKNININSPNVAEPRKGFERLADSWDNAADRTKRFAYYKDKLCAVHDDAGSSFYDRLEYYNSGTWTNLGQISISNTYRTAQSNGNLYITSVIGVRKWDELAAKGLNFFAGSAKGLDLQAAAAGDGSGFLTSGETVAYRIIWGYEDSNENLILGSPSARVNFTGSGGGTDNVDVTASVPEFVRNNLAKTWIYRLYRSIAVSSGFPSDEMQLVVEGEYTSGPTTTSITIADTTTEDLRGATLYTSVSQEGIENANEPPPIAKDLAVFRECMFYANTRSKDRFILTFNDVASMANADTIDITNLTSGSETFTAAAAENIGSFDFQLFTAGTAEENNRNTALSFCRVMNRSTSAYYAFYLGNESTGEDLGKVLIERRVGTETGFAVTASNGAPLLPATIPTSGTDVQSTRDDFDNGLAWSKPFQPEAVPLPNQTRVASKDAEIQRVIALDEALMIFKEDGLYRLTGYYPSFEIELVDASLRLVGNDTLAVLSNQIYCLTTQGVAVVSSSGFKIISTPLEDEIFEKFETHIDNMKTYSHGVGHEATRRYYLFHPETSNDTNATRAYVYNLFTKTWTVHTIEADVGLAEEQQFWLGDSNSHYVITERSSGTNRDYADYNFSTTITATSGRTITLNSGTDNITAGDILFENSTVYSIIESVDTINSQVAVVTNPGFTNTSVDILSAIDTEMKWLPWDMQMPMINKQIHTCIPMFKAGFAGTAYLDFNSDIDAAISTVQLDGSTATGWGLAPWGTFPWGDSPVKKPFRQWVPRSKQRCTWLTVGFRHKYGFSQWKLQGIRLIGTQSSEKVSR